MEICDKIYCVYVHTNQINGKKYVGQTRQNPIKRWNAGRGYKKNPFFWNAIQKYGWQNFKHEIIATNLTKTEADELEKKLIKEWRLLNPEYGYNLHEGGANGSVSDVAKQNMSKAKSGVNHPWYGKHLPEAIRKKISESKNGTNNSFYGKHHTEETKKKIREANSGDKGHNSKKVYQYDLQGNFIKEWNSMTDFATAYNIGRTTVMNHCRNGKPLKNKFILKLKK